MLKGGGVHKRFEVVITRELEVLAILNGGGDKKVSAFKKERGREKFYPVLRSSALSFGPAIFPFVSPPPPRNQ